MKTALRIHIALNEFVVGVIGITVLVGAVAYFKVHPAPAPPAPPAPPCPTIASVKEPTVEISQIIYFIPVPVKVNVKVEMPKPPDTFTPDPNLDNAPPPQPDADPVFQHRTPIITSALRTPMSELDKK